MYEFKGFGKRIEVLRKKKGLTQDDLATRLGITSQAVSKWENDLSYPDITIIPTICTILDTTLDSLFGKVEKEMDNLKFPAIYKGLEFITSFKNIGCYSSKALKEINGTNITFEDGSMAELANRLVTNKGKGDIILKVFDDEDECPVVSGNTEYNFECDKVSNLTVDILVGEYIIKPSESDKTKVYAKGSPEFIDILRCECKKNEHDKDTLYVKYDESRRHDFKDTSENKVCIELACDESNNLHLSINGSGDTKVLMPFINGALNINGSGDIETQSFTNAGICINGSGDINCEDIINMGLTINGSGDVQCKNTVNVASTINGSGDFIVEESHNFVAKIHGSGDINIKNLKNTLNASINGSGDINIEDGNLEIFEVYVRGSGDIDARNVTTEKAKIDIDNGCVKLGRVKKESVEKCGDSGEIIIYNRGE